jgi:hypothetical protein
MGPMLQGGGGALRLRFGFDQTGSDMAQATENFPGFMTSSDWGARLGRAADRPLYRAQPGESKG